MSVDRTKWGTKLNDDLPPADRFKGYEGPTVFYDENVTVANGYATIQVREEIPAKPYLQAQGRFTGGLLMTKTEYPQRFNQGRFEIRCRFPVDPQRRWLGHALWPAFWLIGGDCNREEIDIFELNDKKLRYGAPPGAANRDRGVVYTTLHGIAGGVWAPDRNINCENCIGTTPAREKKQAGFSNLTDGNFHTFALEWEPACITWFIDGKPVGRHERFYTTTGQSLGCSVPAGTYRQHPVWPVHDLRLVIDLKLGKQADDEPPGRAPANFDIDYVRVYQRLAENDPRNLGRPHPAVGPDELCPDHP